MALLVRAGTCEEYVSALRAVHKLKSLTKPVSNVVDVRHSRGDGDEASIGAERLHAANDDFENGAAHIGTDAMDLVDAGDVIREHEQTERYARRRTRKASADRA